MDSDALNFDGLVAAIERTHSALAEQASKAVNVSLTLRNWCTGCYLAEFEQSGTDRAQYGAQLLDKVSARLLEVGMGGVAARSLRQYRQFYFAYPQIWQTPSAKLESPAGDIRETLSPETGSLPTRLLLDRLSFSHFAELLQLDNPLQRRFYEAEALRGNWSVRELKRQIATQYFQRSGLSADQDALARLAHAQAEPQHNRQVIRDPYIFGFIGLKPQEVMSEGHLEDALLDKLQGFLLELGHGFCFEARQKRLLIGGEHFFVDLVFYHRILKCHVLIELKNDAFKHEHLGQLNSYVGSPAKRNERRRPAAHRHPALHAQEPRTGRVRAGRHEQQAVRLALPGATAGQGRNGGLPAQGGGRVGGRG